MKYIRLIEVYTEQSEEGETLYIPSRVVSLENMDITAEYLGILDNGGCTDDIIFKQKSIQYDYGDITSIFYIHKDWEEYILPHLLNKCSTDYKITNKLN